MVTCTERLMWLTWPWSIWTVSRRTISHPKERKRNVATSATESDCKRSLKRNQACLLWKLPNLKKNIAVTIIIHSSLPTTTTEWKINLNNTRTRCRQDYTRRFSSKFSSSYRGNLLKRLVIGLGLILKSKRIYWQVRRSRSQKWWVRKAWRIDLWRIEVWRIQVWRIEIWRQ